MNIHQLMKLTAPFRRDNHSFLAGALQYDDIIIRHYLSIDTIGPELGPVAALRISDLSVIKQFITLISFQHRDQHQKLFTCLQQINGLLAAQIENGQANPPGNALLVTVDNFQGVLNCLRQQVHSRFLWNLHVLAADACCCGGTYITTGDIDAVITLMAHFNDEFQRFYEEMDTVFYAGESLVQSRTDNRHLNELLASVLLLAERSILLEDDLLVGLSAWRKTIADRDTQQLLN